MEQTTTSGPDGPEGHDRHTMLAMLSLIGARALVDRGEPVDQELCDLARMPSRRIALGQGLEPWRRLPVAAGDETIGLSVAEGAGVTAFHHLGVAFASAPHLLAAVQSFARYFPYLCQAAHVFEYSLHGETVIGWEDGAGQPPHALRDYLFAELVWALRTYGWQPVVPLGVEIAGLDGELAPAYRRAFGCPVRSGGSTSRIVLDTRSLAVPLRGSNPTLHHHVCLRLTADEAGGRSASRRVSGALEQLLDRGETRIEAVADQLGTQVRSLQSALAAEGFRYSELLRRVRQRRAVQLLCESGIPIRSVAHALGYGDSSSFQRAFREWFGVTPTAFRESHCGR